MIILVNKCSCITKNMNIKLIRVLSLAILIFSCQNKQGNQSEISAINTLGDTTELAKFPLNFDFDKLESIKSENGLYQFKIPKDLFKRKNENEFYSDVLKSKIIFHFSETSQIDAANAIWKKIDLVNKMKENILVTYSVAKNDWAIVSGTTNKGEIIYKKGIYFKPKDNHLGENGRNTQPYCFTGIIEIIYPTEQKDHFNKLIPILVKSFKCDFLSQCGNCIEQL